MRAWYLRPALRLLTTRDTVLVADLRVDITVDLSTSRQSRLFTRRMQSFTLKETQIRIIRIENNFSEA